MLVCVVLVIFWRTTNFYTEQYHMRHYLLLVRGSTVRGRLVLAALLPFFRKCRFEKFDCVRFDLDILEGVFNVVTRAAGIAVNAPVLTSAIDVHSV